MTQYDVCGCCGKPKKPKALSKRWPANLILSHVPPDANGEGGCVRVGTRKVKGSNVPGPNSTIGTLGYGGGDGEEGVYHYADENGHEEVEAWECARDEAGNYICPIALMDEQSGTLKSGGGIRKPEGTGRRVHPSGWPERGRITGESTRYEASEGGSSRFFLNLPPEPDTGAGFFYAPKASRRERTANGTVENNHPTVKNLSLMRYLVKLVTPPGGTVLDCFAGSGSTGVACAEEGFDCILVEQDESYVEIAKKRVAHALKEKEGALF